MLVPNSPTLNNSCPTAIAVNSSGLYWLGTQGSSLTLDSAPLSGGTATTLATIPNSTGSNDVLYVNRSMALFVTSQNGPSILQEVPLSGGAPTGLSTQLNNQSGGLNVFVADDNFVYVANSMCSCNNGNDKNNTNSNGTLPVGTINIVALNGSGGATLAQFRGMASGMAQDATYVYWSTDTTVYKVPKAGGVVTRIAGNLGNGTIPYLCQGCGSTTVTNSVAIAVDGTSVYIADAVPNIDLDTDANVNVNAILKVAK
jgi:hypothetical protein